MQNESSSSHYTSSFSPRVSEWLAECGRIHPLCSSRRPNLRSQHFIPTRLIDLEPPDSQVQPKLVITAQSSIDDWRYVALSHRWFTPIGDPTKVTTTRWGTLEERLGGIDLEHGQVNFRFASDLCRMLKIRYLWIDCYCINQGDKDDWETESNRMDKVYAGAYCTIAINRKLTNDLSIDQSFNYDPAVYSQDVPSSGWLNDIGRHSNSAEGSQFLLRAIKYGPLGERAWCFQERMLSPRVLYFLDGGAMLWECCTYIGITGWPSNLPSIPILNQYLDSKGSSAGGYKRLIDYEEGDAYESNPVDCPCADEHETLDDEDENDSYNSEDEQNFKFPAPFSNVSNSFSCIRYSRSNSIVLDAWYAAISEYSRRTLTEETDRPIALRGYINKIVEVSGSEYHYGILARDAARGLLWLPDAQVHGGTLRPSLPDLPSWSWLNARQPVKLVCSPGAAAWYFRNQILRAPYDRDHQRGTAMPEIGTPQIYDLEFSEQGKVLSLTGLLYDFPARSVARTSGHDLRIYDRHDVRAALLAGQTQLAPIALGCLDFPEPGQKYSKATVLLLSSRFGLLVEVVDLSALRFRRIGIVSCAHGERGLLSRLRMQTQTSSAGRSDAHLLAQGCQEVRMSLV